MKPPRVEKPHPFSLEYGIANKGGAHITARIWVEKTRKIVRRHILIGGALFLGWPGTCPASPPAADFLVGTAAVKITPTLEKGRPVWMAGFGHGRSADGVHDDLWARALVVTSQGTTLALVSLDLVGYFIGEVDRVRSRLTKADPKLATAGLIISSTHTHSGPDTLGIWGPDNGHSGVDRRYMDSLVERISSAILQAAQNRRPARLFVGCGKTRGLTNDLRLPKILDENLAILQAKDSKGKILVTAVNGSNHPEDLGQKNRQISADYCHWLIRELEERTGAPAVFVNGAIGGLMTPLEVKIDDPDTGHPAPQESYRHAELVGRKIACEALALAAVAHEMGRTGVEIRRREVRIPLNNTLYRAALGLGIMQRGVYTLDQALTGPLGALLGKDIRTEVGIYRIGDLVIGAIPGELYPELSLGQYQEPQDPGADYQGARREPGLRAILGRVASGGGSSASGDSHCLFVIGLANDEIGYIIPRSEWDESPPFCYGRAKKQYGEVNSCGSDTAPVLLEALEKLVGTTRPGGSLPSGVDTKKLHQW